MSHTKERPKRLQRKWTDVERRIILDYLKKTIKLGYKIEKPNTKTYYNKLIAETKLKNLTPVLLKNQVRNLSTKYKDALKWCAETGQGIVESEGQTSFESALLTRYPYFYDFDEIWGTKQTIHVPYSVSSRNQIDCKSSLNKWNQTVSTCTQEKEDDDNLETNILTENIFINWNDNHVPNADKPSLPENGLGILHNECANCTKSFGDGIRNTMLTTLMFTDFGFASSIEDITNFQAISYIYGVSPTLLEKSIKKHLLTFSKQGDNPTFKFSDINEEDDPLSSFNLTLCQNCSSTLAELYTAFNKFEKLSNKRSIISTGIHLSKINVNVNCQEIKLEDLCEVADGKKDNIFNELNNENAHSEGEEFQWDSIKEEELAWEFNEINSNDNISSEGNNYNVGDDDFENCVPMETENNQNKNSIGIVTRKSKRKSVHVQMKIPSDEEDHEDEDLCVSSKVNYSPEGSDYSDSEKTNYPLYKSEKRRKRPKEESDERERMKGFNTNITNGTKSAKACECFRCGKRIVLFYRKKLHELIHKLDIPNLQKEILKGRESICPKCGFDFKCGRFHGPLRLKTHCLKEHNLIVAKCLPELEEFTQYLISEKNYCDKNEINKNISHNKPVLNDQLDQRSCKIALPVQKINKTMKQLENEEYKKVFRYYSPRCIACGIYFPNFRKLKRHYRLNHNIIWKDTTSFEKWMEICEEKSYNCDICDEFFVSKDQLEIHLIVHNDDKNKIMESSEIIQGPPFQCPNCKDSSNCYENWTQLQMHGYKIHKVKFKNHLVINNPRFQTNYFCNDCDVPFVVRLAWVTHMRNVHHQVVCESCCENFSNEQLLQLHVATIHVGQTPITNTPKYNCKNCNKIFPNVKSLWLHTFVHIAEENPGNIEKQYFETFAAPLINCSVEELTDGNDIFSTRYSDALSVGGDIFSCVKCLKGFKSHHTMKIHNFASIITDFDKLDRRTVVGRKFQCPICKFDCKRNIILREHCLSQHNTIVSTESYSTEEFIKELRRERANCAKLLSSRREGVTNSNPKPTKAFYCFRCGKRIDLFYRRKLHELIHSLDIPNLEKEMIEGHGTPGSDSICPKCGINFKCNRFHGPLRLKTHCLEKHNLIVYRSLSELEKFTRYLIGEKNYCDTNQNNDNIDLKKQTLANKLTAVKTIASEEDESNNAPSTICHLKDNDVTENISVDGENNLTILSTDTFENQQTRIPAEIQENLSEMSPAEKAEFLTCKVCGVATFDTVKGKHIHFIRHFEVKSMKVEMVPGPPFICPRCSNVQSTIPSLREHCILAHGFNVNTYSKRPKTANRNKPSSRNKTKPSIPKNGDQFICDSCGKVLKSNDALREHKITHDAERKLICDKCGASFRQMKLFRYHKRLHFERDTGVRPSCNICKKRFVTSKGVMKHKRNYHSTKERRTCPICNRTFSSLDYAVKHIRKHGESSNT